MPTLAFCLSLLALLFAPGPTNALLALSGAERGAARTLHLLPLVLLAYAITVLPLAELGDDLLQQRHAVRAGVSFAAALWLAWMAIALWRQPAADVTGEGDRRGLRLFITTLLNPKAFIIGLVLIPAQPSRGAALALFFVVLAAAAVAWAMVGAALNERRWARNLIRRACAGWLGSLAVLLGSAAFSS